MRVLNILETLDRGGIETFILNNYAHMDGSKVKYDYLIMRTSPYRGVEQQVLANGGKIFRYEPKRTKLLSHVYNIYTTLRREGPYDVVQAHWGKFNGVVLFLAWVAGVKKRFSFIHLISNPSPNPLKRGYHLVFRQLISLFATRKFACSQTAGKSVYLGKFQLFNNAVDTRKFKFNPSVRAEMRRELGVEDKFVIAHTARFAKEKNQPFSLAVLKALLSKCPQAHLVFCGSGTYLDAVKQQAAALKIENAVSFLGAVPNVHEVLQAADAFILPSTWEALGLAAIEAQAAGLPCVLADNIPPEAFVVHAHPMPLKAGAAAWADKLSQLRGVPREDTSSTLANAGFDIRTTAAYLYGEYLK